MGGHLYIEILVGAILITIYAHERFNTPPNVRASTTAARYYLASFIYLMVYLVSFILFTKYPYLLEQLKIVEPPKGDLSKAEQSTPIVIAMVLSLLVPKIPLISSLDSRLRKFLHRLAAIPFEAIRLSRELQECDYKIPGNQDAGHEHTLKVFLNLKEQGFEEPQSLFESDLPFMKTWISLTSMLIQLNGWESSTQFSVFVLERAGQLERIKDHYTRSSKLVHSAFVLNQEMEKHKELNNELNDIFRDVTNKFTADMNNELKSVYSEMCDFISHGMLKTCFMGSSRARTLNAMGFDGIRFTNQPGLSINSTITLFGILLVLILINFILFQPKDAVGKGGLDSTGMLLMIIMIVSIYAASVICAVLPKQFWISFRSSDRHDYPVAAYVASGIMAVLASLIINLCFKTLLFAHDPNINGFVAPFVLAWKNFYTSSYPWLAMSFVCTVTLAFLIDWQHPKWIKEKWQRVADGIVQAAALVGAVFLVHWWLAGLVNTAKFDGHLPDIVQVIRLSAVIGSVLGYLVPTWYRRSARFEAEQAMMDTNGEVSVARLKRVT